MVGWFSKWWHLKFRRKMLVEDLIDLEVRMTTSTRMFPSTPTDRTMLWADGDGDGNEHEGDDEHEGGDEHEEDDEHEGDDECHLNRTKLV